MFGVWDATLRLPEEGHDMCRKALPVVNVCRRDCCGRRCWLCATNCYTDSQILASTQVL